MDRADPQLSVELVSESARTTVRVEGDLDLSTLPKLRLVLAHLCQEPPPELFVDLALVSFLDAGTLGLLSATAQRVHRRGGRVVVRACQRHARLFHLCGLQYLLAGGPHPSTDGDDP